jgi:hypothetical protein
VIKRVAKTIVDLGGKGIQVFIATHSLFLLRELEILVGDQESDESRFFGLHIGEAGVTVKQGPTVADIGDMAVLDEELEQSDRYMDKEAQN